MVFPRVLSYPSRNRLCFYRDLRATDLVVSAVPSSDFSIWIIRLGERARLASLHHLHDGEETSLNFNDGRTMDCRRCTGL